MGGSVRLNRSDPESSGKPKEVTAGWKELKRIGRYLLPAWKPSLLILLCILVTSCLGLVSPFLMGRVIDVAIPTRNGRLLNWYVAAMIVAPLLSGLVGVWQNYLITVMAQGVMFDLRNEMYGKLLRQSLRFFTATKSGEIQSRIQNDVGGVQGVVSGTLVSVATNTLMLLSTLAVIIKIDWLLSLVAVGILPFFILPTRRVGQIRKKLSTQTQERLAELTSYIQETLSVSGFLLTRLFGAQVYEAGRFREKAGAVRDLQIQQSMLGRWFFMFIMMFATVGPALIFLVGGHEAIAGRLTVGIIVTFVFYLGRLYGSATGLVNVHVEIMSAAGLFGRIFRVPRSAGGDRGPGRADASLPPTRRVAVRGRVDGLRHGRADRRGCHVRGAARPDDRARRPERRRQDDRHLPRVPAVRPVPGPHHLRRRGSQSAVAR